MEQSSSAEIAAISARLFQSSNHKGTLVASISDLADALHHALPPDVDATGQTSNLGFIHRKLDGMDLYYVVNSSNQPVSGNIKFRAAHSTLESWNPDGGAVLTSMAYDKSAGIPLRLAPYESRVFVLGDTPAQKSVNAQHQEASLLQDLSSGWQIRFGDEALPNRRASCFMDRTSGQAVLLRQSSLHADVHFAGSSRSQGARASGLWRRRCNHRQPAAHALRNARPSRSSHPRGRHRLHQRAAGCIALASALSHRHYFVPQERRKPHRSVTVYNTAVNEMAGQPPRDYTALNARYGKRFDMQDMDHLQPVPSGLMGPIHLLEERPQ
jgi:hypothetical protein